MIEKWKASFEKAGFSSYMIDFSDCPVNLIEHLGKAIDAFFEKREG